MNNIKTTQEKTYPTNKYFDILNKSKDSSIHSHKFTRITFEKDNSKTILNINCIETYIKETNIGYFEAEYEFLNYIDGIQDNNIIPQSHPFYDIPKKHFKNYCQGFLVVRNDLTCQLLKYLFMDDEKLEKECGVSKTHYYKIGILKSLANLWD
mgnify:CR=1 FL=1